MATGEKKSAGARPATGYGNGWMVRTVQRHAQTMVHGDKVGVWREEGGEGARGPDGRAASWRPPAMDSWPISHPSNRLTPLACFNWRSTRIERMQGPPARQPHARQRVHQEEALLLSLQQHWPHHAQLGKSKCRGNPSAGAASPPPPPRKLASPQLHRSFTSKSKCRCRLTSASKCRCPRVSGTQAPPSTSRLKPSPRLRPRPCPHAPPSPSPSRPACRA